MKDPLYLASKDRSVLSFPSDNDHPFCERSILIEDLLDYIANRLHHTEELLEGGVSCELLKPDGEGWKKGKIKLAIEFYPENEQTSDISQLRADQPVSELDALRQM